MLWGKSLKNGKEKSSKTLLEAVFRELWSHMMLM